MRKIIIIIVVLTIIPLLKYLWYTELEMISYENKTYEKFSDDLTLYQRWYPEGYGFKLWLPYKKNIIASPFIYTISFNAKNSDIDSITFNEIRIILPNEQLDILNSDIDIVINNYEELSIEKIEKFKRTGNIVMEEKRFKSSYDIVFFDVEIPFKKIKNFHTVISVTIHYKSGEAFTKRITTEFEQKIDKRLIFPTA